MQLLPLRVRLRKTAADLSMLESGLRAQGAPWTPFRVPDWPRRQIPFQESPGDLLLASSSRVRSSFAQPCSMRLASARLVTEVVHCM